MAGLTIPIDGAVEVRVTTRGTSGGLMDATGNVTVSVYEDSSTTEMAFGPLTMTNYATGKYRTAFTMSAANGFEATKMYSVQVNGTVDGVTDAYDVLSIYCQSYALASALATLSTIFSGITSLAHWLGLIAGKQTPNSTAQTEIRATGAGSGSYDATTDSLEANRDNVGTAGANLTIAAVTGAVGSVTGAVGSVTGNVGGNVTGSVGSVAGAVGSVTGNVGGNVVGSVGSVTGLTASNLDATISSRATPAQVNSEADTALSDWGKTGFSLTSAYDLYHADIQFTVDEANTQDEYTISWFKNGVRQTSGITVPTLQVVKRADGSDLIASTTPTQIASTGTYKHDATTTARITAGQAVLAIVTATIDGSTRSFSKLIGRDST